MRCTNRRVAPLVAGLLIVAAGCGSSSAAADASSVHSSSREHAKVTRNQPNEGSRGALASANPCRYVPARQAASILGVATVQEVEAPLGPTCILKAHGRKVSATIAVEVIDVSKQVHVMKHVSKTMLGRRTAYCGKLGTSMMLVALKHNQVLQISAPCSKASKLAKVALTRITA